MEAITVADLKKVVDQIEDDSLPIRLINVSDIDDNGDDKPNYWLQSIEVSDKGASGYEIGGEIRLISTE